MHNINIILVAVLSFLIIGCESSSHLLVGEKRGAIHKDRVNIYTSPPKSYEVIAILDASSKNSFSFTAQQQLDYSISLLKKEAAKLGANGVIIKYIDDEQLLTSYTNSYGNVVYSSASHKKLKALAIYVKSSTSLKNQQINIENKIDQILFGECTTAPSTYFESKIEPDNSMNAESMRSIAITVLGKTTSKKGQWFYEKENENIIFSGYKTRDLYLNVAIIVTENEISTVVCDIKNLNQRNVLNQRKLANQRKNYIDKRVLKWKMELNKLIKSEMLSRHP